MVPEEKTTQPSATASVRPSPLERKKKTYRYSPGLEPLQRVERAMTRAQRRLADAVLAGLSTWEKRRDKSAHKRKDGAVLDSLSNSIAATAKMLRVASKAGEDLVNELKPRSRRKKYRVYLPFKR